MPNARTLVTEDPDVLLYRYGEDILSSPSFQSMKNYTHHQFSNTYDHCISVALRALILAKKHKKKVDIESLVRASLLHDYYLYNHRTSERIKWHLIRHPRIAAKNAVRDFGVSKDVVRIIKSHMWPLTFFHFPTKREAWLLMRADKIVSYHERFQKEWKDQPQHH